MVATSSSARRGKVKKNLVREVHHVFRCPKYIKIVFLCFKIILSNQREVQSDNNGSSRTTWCVFHIRKIQIK